MVGTSNHEERGAAIKRSLEHIIEAIDLLDAHEGPPDAAAHLELARQRLSEVMNQRESRLD